MRLRASCVFRARIVALSLQQPVQSGKGDAMKNAHKKQLMAAVAAIDWDLMGKILARYLWRKESVYRRLQARAIKEDLLTVRECV